MNVTTRDCADRSVLVDAAIGAGVSRKDLLALLAARFAAKGDTIRLPGGRYAHCSRATGWARKRWGDGVEWGERVPGGWLVGPGSWTVHSSDGFTRRERVIWSVRTIRAATGESWTIAD